MKLERLTAEQVAPFVQVAAAGDWPLIADEINRGQAEAWCMDEGRAHLVTRVDDRGMVIVLAEGRGVIANDQALRELARKKGAKAVLFHISRPSFFRVVERLGYEQIERVYRVKV